jgi:diketogulonate reductase-like aldo/keto reductase
MHCQDTRDSEGTWQGSWRAMERAYAEGSLNAIGVSNFDIDLLSQFSYTDEPDPEFVHLIKPHLIQNWAEPGNLDRNVIEWCDRNYAIFQPYASGILSSVKLTDSFSYAS